MSESVPVPFLDLVGLHRDFEEQLVAAFRAAVRTCQFIGGPEVSQFEQEYAAFCGSKCCVGVGSGTDALRFALMAVGVKEGDIVVTVSNTFIATTEAISQAGAWPQFVDIDRRTYNMDPDRLREFFDLECESAGAGGGLLHKATGRPVTAVVPVHLYGQMADTDAICALAAERGLWVVEDACQAHGAEYFSKKAGRWLKAGSVGHAAAFSFYPGKNLGACGEAGAVTTDDAQLAERIRKLRDHGQIKKYHHEVEGYNGRLDALQAAFLRVKLPRLAEMNASRRDAATRYREGLRDVAQIVLPHEPEHSRSVCHLYVIRARDRDDLQAHLNRKGIFTGLHYPIPLHQQQAYARRNHGPFPVTEEVAPELLSLPMFPGLAASQQARVTDEIKAFYAASAA
jgi:dTDP-4-amino-4,6-dideoxygalactose transaminase